MILHPREMVKEIPANQQPLFVLLYHHYEQVANFSAPCYSWKT